MRLLPDRLVAVLFVSAIAFSGSAAQAIVIKADAPTAVRGATRAAPMLAQAATTEPSAPTAAAVPATEPAKPAPESAPAPAVPAAAAPEAAAPAGLAAAL